MAYVDPQTVVAPQRRLSHLRVVYNSGPGGFAVATFLYNGENAIGIRWNGSESEPGMGNPQSSANPTWFVLPEGLAQRALDWADENDTVLQEGYRAMAADTQREAEAWEWSEGLIGDVADSEG